MTPSSLAPPTHSPSSAAPTTNPAISFAGGSADARARAARRRLASVARPSRAATGGATPRDAARAPVAATRTRGARDGRGAHIAAARASSRASRCRDDVDDG